MGSSAMTLGTNDLDKGQKVKGQGHVPDSEFSVFNLIERIFSVFSSVLRLTLTFSIHSTSVGTCILHYKRKDLSIVQEQLTV